MIKLPKNADTLLLKKEKKLVSLLNRNNYRLKEYIPHVYPTHNEFLFSSGKAINLLKLIERIESIGFSYKEKKVAEVLNDWRSPLTTVSFTFSPIGYRQSPILKIKLDGSITVLTGYF